MIEKIQKYQRPLLIGLIVICAGIMAIGAVVYLERITDNLKNDSIQDVMNVTIEIPVEQMASYDALRYYTKTGSYVLEAGDYEISIT